MQQKQLNVLSLFDGASGGQQALDRLKIKVDNYYASEIDKYAIQVTMANYPNTIQLGSVIDVDVSKLEKIDLLCGGSPCQSFSFAGKRKGMSTKDSIEILTLEHYLELKNQNLEFEGQSYLFWEYMRILTDIRKVNPNVKFLLENVIMGEKWQRILTQAIGINPIEINSALLSAQNRKRLYFTNIGAEQDGLFGDLKCMIPQPKDKGILLKDILEAEVDNKYYLSDKTVNTLVRHGNNIIGKDENPLRSCTIHANYFKMGGRDQQHVIDDSKIVAMRGRNPENTSDRTKGCPTKQMLEAREDGKTNCITTVQKDNLVYTKYSENQFNNKRLNETIDLHKDNLEEGTMIDSYNKSIHKDKSITITTRVNASSSTHIVHTSVLNKNQKDNLVYTANYLQYGDGFAQDSRAYYENGKHETLDVKDKRPKVLSESRIRRLTPLECCRLQTMRDDYFIKESKDIVSDSQKYRQIGNGWTIEVIAYIFSFLKP
jgi:DNA-cytosine methyltransferase